MSKVKLTQEQADELEGLKCQTGLRFNYWLKKHVEQGFENEFSSLNDLITEEFARAWIEGYEVEPQFEKGDVVVVDWSDAPSTLYKVINHRKDSNVIYFENSLEENKSSSRITRHATKLEKQLFEVGRTEPELKHGDVIGVDWNCFYLVSQLTDLGHSTLSLSEASSYLRQDKVLHIYPIEHRIEVGDENEQVI